MNKLFNRKTGLFTLVVLLIAVMVVGMMTLLGGSRVSEVFYSVDSGLNTMGTSGEPASFDSLPSTDALASQQTQRRLIIKHANISVEVEDVRNSETAIGTMTEEMGGYVVATNNDGVDENMTSQMTIRVPSKEFDPALEHIQQLSLRVLSQQVSGEDVSAEFVDLESRLHNLESTRDRLRGFLDESGDMQDALAVSEALTRVQGEIEQIQGRMNYLEKSAAMSTIKVSLSLPMEQRFVDEDIWQPLEVARVAFDSMLGLGKLLINVSIVLGVWIPVWLPLLVVGWWVRRRWLVS